MLSEEVLSGDREANSAKGSGTYIMPTFRMGKRCWGDGRSLHPDCVELPTLPGHSRAGLMKH